MSDWDEEDTSAVIQRVSEAFAARSTAAAKVSRCRRSDSLERAREEFREADKIYRLAAADRDEFMEIRLAQRSQGKISPITLTVRNEVNRGR